MIILFTCFCGFIFDIVFDEKDNNHDDGHDNTAPVKSYKPNAWGLYDMHGNVYEWCEDAFAWKIMSHTTDEAITNEDEADHVIRDGGRRGLSLGGTTLEFARQPGLRSGAALLFNSIISEKSRGFLTFSGNILEPDSFLSSPFGIKADSSFLNSLDRRDFVCNNKKAAHDLGSRTAFIPLAPPGTRQKGVDHAESYSNSRTYSDLCYDRNGQL